MSRIEIAQFLLPLSSAQRLSSMDTSNSVRFLAAFNRIEGYLREHLNGRRDVGFTGNVRQLAPRNALVRMYSEPLLQYAKLRNIIIHTLREDFIIAEPHILVVEEMERIAEVLHRPPIVADYMVVNPYSVHLDASVADVVKVFKERGFMRCPVLSGHGIVGLITAKSISRWLAELDMVDATRGLALTLQIALDTPVEQLLPYCSPSEYAVVPRTLPLAEVVSMFRKSITKGQYLQSMLVTVTGEVSSPLVGILAPSDLPRLLDTDLSLYD